MSTGRTAANTFHFCISVALTNQEGVDTVASLKLLLCSSRVPLQDHTTGCNMSARVSQECLETMLSEQRPLKSHRVPRNCCRRGLASTEDKF